VDPEPSPCLPAYGGACLDGVVPALLASAGRRPEWLPAPAADAAQVAVLVLDGLGWLQLRRRFALAPALAAMAGGPITSVAPTTTATALASISFGAPPARHGVVGYRVRVAPAGTPGSEEVLNVLRWTTAAGDARERVPPAGWASGRAFAGRPVPVVTRAGFAGSGFTDAHLPGADLRPYHLPSGIAVEVRRALREGAPLVYAYYDGIDTVAHRHGFGEHYDAELAAADRLVAELVAGLPGGAALVVTADHGQVDVGARAQALDPAVLGGVRLLSGEGRFCWLHARPGAAADVADAVRAVYGAQAWVRSLDEVEAEGWLGDGLGPVARDRLGDVAVVAHAPVAFLEPGRAGEVRLVCRHGSLTPEEMLVPLLAACG